MAELDARSLARRAVLLGLIGQEQALEARADADDGSVGALTRTMLRKGMLTSWQLERLKRGDPSGFFYGDCKVLFYLAEGTFARVYRGVRMTSGEPVAVKVLRRRFFTDPAAVDRFKKEAEAGMALRHPNIVRILDYGERDRRVYMIMEYIEGSNLRDFLKIRRRLAPEAALPLMIGLARGLKYSSDHGVTHRDIKATNILIGSRGAAKLVDFGLATIAGEEKSGSAMVNRRTVDYSALERTCGSPKGDPRSDIFFLGCAYYQMLTGQPAMAETETKDMLQKMLKRSFGAIKPISGHRDAPDPELCRIIEKMMKIDPKARHQTIGQVLDDLEAYAKRDMIEGAGSGSESAAPESEHDISLDGLEGASIFIRPVEEPPEPPESAGPPPRSVLCVESQREVREAFREALSRMGYRVLLAGDPGRAAARYREASPDAVIYDLDGLGRDSIDAFRDLHDRAHEDGHDLAALVLLGPRQLALREELSADDRLVVLAKPITMRQVQDAIAQLVPIG